MRLVESPVQTVIARDEPIQLLLLLGLDSVFRSPDLLDRALVGVVLEYREADGAVVGQEDAPDRAGEGRQSRCLAQMRLTTSRRPGSVIGSRVEDFGRRWMGRSPYSSTLQKRLFRILLPPVPSGLRYRTCLRWSRPEYEPRGWDPRMVSVLDGDIWISLVILAGVEEGDHALDGGWVIVIEWQDGG